MVTRIPSVNETFDFPPAVRARILDLVGGPPGAPLDLTVYNPATQAQHGVNTTTFTAISPAELAVTFTAPASGAVIVDLEAHIQSSTSRSYWALLNGSTVINPTLVCGAVVEGDALRGRARIPVTGLTAGQTYTLQWAAAAQTGSIALRVGGTGLGTASSGPATMTVWAAP